MKTLLSIMLLAASTAGASPPQGEVGLTYAETARTQHRLGLGAGFCGATAVAPNILLTASHCLAADSTTVPVGGELRTILERVDDGKDHALIRVDGSHFPAIARVRVARPRYAENLHVHGGPRSYTGRMFRRGYVMGQDEYKTAAWGVPYYVLDMLIFFGDSGSGVFDDNGLLVCSMSAIDIDVGDQESRIQTAACLGFSFTTQQLVDIKS